MPLTDEQAAALGLPPAPKKRATLTAAQAAERGLVEPDDPTEALSGGQPMSARELDLAGMGQGAVKTWMGLKDVAGRVPGLGGIRPSSKQWEEFNRMSGPLLRAQRSDPEATVSLPAGLTQGMSPEDIAYVQMKANEAARTPSNPGAEGSVGGALLATVPVGMGAGKLAGPLIGRLVPKAAQGAAQGLVEGAAAGSVASDQGDRLEGAAIGGTTGGLLGWLLQSAGLFKPRTQTGTKAPRVQPIPEAQLLERAGVTNLTPGQKAPGSWWGNIESSTKKALGGLEPEREAAKQQWMRVAQDQGLPPGTASPAAKDLQVRTNEILNGFNEAYSQFADAPMNPEAITRAVSGAKPGGGVPASITGRVSMKVADALSSLGENPEMTVGAFQKVRSYIRDAKLAARAADNFDEAMLLKKSEDVLTQAMEESLGPQAAKAFRDVDQQYARFSTALEAPTRGNTEFTPGQYLRQVATRAGNRTFRRGGAGDLQDLGEAAAEVFTEVPPTGVTKTILGSIPGANIAAAPIARLANTGPAQRFLFSPRATYSPLQSSVPGATAVQSPQIRALIDLMERMGVQLAPAMGEETK